MQGGSCDGGLEVGGDDLHPTGGLDGVKIDPPFSCIAHFRHALGSLKPLDVRLEWTVLTGQHD